MWTWIKKHRKKAAVVLGYSFFALVMFALFFYLTFPWGLLESRLILSLENNTGCKIQVREKKSRLPLRVVWNGVQGACANGPFSHWEIESIDARLSPLPLLLNRRGEIDFEAHWAGGIVNGRLTAVRRSEGISFSLKNEGKRLNMTQWDPGISGLLDLEGEASWTGPEIWKGKGGVSFTMEGVRVKEIGKWPVPVGEVSFSNIRGQVEWRAGRMVIGRLAAQGAEVDLTSDGGSLLFREPLEGSLMSWTLKVTPKGNLQQAASVFVQGYTGKEPLTMGVNGPLNHLQLSLNGKSLNL